MAEYTLDDVPTGGEISSGVWALRPLFREGYKRSKAYSMFPSNRLAVASDEEIQALKASNELVSVDGSWESRTGGSGGDALAIVDGYYRWSELLGIYMPVPIPEATRGNCDEATRSAWAASTAEDDDAIDSYATENARDDIDAIQSAFAEVFAETRIYALQAMLERLNEITEGMTDLIDKHEGKEFEELFELWESWEGSDADASYEDFGAQVEPAAGTHREMLGPLVQCASEEGVAQAAVHTALNNALADAQQKVEDTLGTGGYSWGTEAVARLSGAISVNRVPFLSDILAVVDFGVEIATEGEKQGYTSGWIDWVLGELFTGFPGVPTQSLVQDLRDDLKDAAEAARNSLYDDRSARRYLDDSLYTYESARRGTPYTIIPGYRE